MHWEIRGTQRSLGYVWCTDWSPLPFRTSDLTMHGTLCLTKTQQWKLCRESDGQNGTACCTVSHDAPSRLTVFIWLLSSIIPGHSVSCLFYRTFNHCLYLAVVYRQVSNITRTSVGYKFVDHSDVVGASPVSAAPTTSSFPTKRLASLYSAKTTSRRGEEHLNLVIWCVLY